MTKINIKRDFQTKWVAKIMSVEIEYCENNEYCTRILGTILSHLSNPMDPVSLMMYTREAVMSENMPNPVRETLREFLRELLPQIH